MIKGAIFSICILIAVPLAGWSQRGRPPATTSSTPANTSVECSIFGQVVMPDSTPNKGLEVVLETADRIRSLSTTTDDDGRFQFRQLSVTTYYLYMDLDGFAPIEQQVVLQQNGPTASAVVLLHLTKGLSDPTRRTAGADDHVKTERTSATFAADLLTRYPQKAVKEYEQGRDELAKGNLDKAQGHFEKATGDAAQFYEAWLELGRTRQRLGRFDPADQAFHQARTLRPQSAQPLIDLGELDLDRARKLENDGNGVEAMTAYRRSLEFLDEASALDPKSQQALYFRGSAQFKVGDLRGAEGSLKAALEGPRPYQDARLMLVNVLMKQRRYQEALDQLNAYLEANPNTPQRKAVEQMQAQIRVMP